MLPVTVSFGRPSRAELLALGGGMVLLISALAWARATAPRGQPAADPPATTAPLAISSTPGAATVLIDGQRRGTTPAVVGVTPGPHDVVLQAQGAATEERTVDVGAGGADLTVSLWRA